jgi:hypothetical protein
MQRILARRAAQEARRQSLSWKDQLAEYNQRSVFLFFIHTYCHATVPVDRQRYHFFGSSYALPAASGIGKRDNP